MRLLYHDDSFRNRIESHDSMVPTLRQRIATQYSYARTARSAVRFALPTKVGAIRQCRQESRNHYTMCIPLRIESWHMIQ